MRKPVTIGDQKFVYSDDKSAWIDEKTGVIANQGMQSLLEVTTNSQLHSPIVSDGPPAPAPKKEEKKEEVQEYKAGEPVNIGGQKFILDTKKGWIDAKTKQIASKDIVKLLEKITGVKVESKFNTSDIQMEPIVIGDQKYIWDVKKQHWIDAKTKQPAEKALEKVLNNVINKAGISKLTDSNLDLGMIGAAAETNIKLPDSAEKTKKKDEKKEVYRVESKKTKSLLVKMVDKLKSIDSTFRLQSDLIALQNQKDYAQARENIVEQKKAAITPNDHEDAKKETKSMLGVGLGIAAVIGIAALAFEPVKESLQTAYDYIKGAYDTTTWLYKTLSDGFNYLLGLGKGALGIKSDTATPVSDKAFSALDVSTQAMNNTQSTPVNKPTSAPAPRASTPAPVATPSPTPKKQAISPLNMMTTTMSNQYSSDNMIKTSTTPQRTGRGGGYDVYGGPRNVVSNGAAIVRKLYPNARITSTTRSAKNRVGKAGSKSWHERSAAAVDVAPIPGLTFAEYVQSFRDAGYGITEAIDETIASTRKKTGATGPHWHIVLANNGASQAPATPGSTPETRNNEEYISKIDKDKPVTENIMLAIKSAAQLLRKIGDTDSHYAGSIEEITKRNTSRIGNVAAQRYADAVQSKDPEANEIILEMPNLNKKEGGTVQTPSTSNDRSIINQYLMYFGFNPSKTIN